MLQWNDNLALDIQDIDEQHKKFLDILNSLLNAIKDKKSREIQAKIIDDLIEYAFYHFSLEERYLDRSKYPHTEQHKKEHEDFVDQIIKFKKDHDEHKITLSINMITFMNKWWIEHVQNSDRKYQSYVVGITLDYD